MMTSLLGVLPLFAGAGMMPADADHAEVITACTQTVHDYAWYLDHPGDDLAVTAAAFADLFTEDGVAVLANARLVEETHEGHAAIEARYLQGRDRLRFFHVMSNVRIQPLSATQASGTSYVTVYIHPIGGSMEEDGAVRVLAEYRDHYVMEEGQCLLTHRRSVVRMIDRDGVLSPPQDE